MIARMWHGVTPTSKAEAYMEYLKETGLSDYRSIEGNMGVSVLRRDEGNEAHFLLISHWTSYDAIKDFAGPDFERARYYPEDEDYLIEKEPHVIHYEVAVQW